MTGSQQGSLRARLETLPRSQVAAWLAVIALALPFAWPFMRGPFPDSGDGLLNLYRVVALDYAVRHGDLWPRFLAAMHFGYGAPNFNYYSPLSLYAIELIHLINGASTSGSPCWDPSWPRSSRNSWGSTSFLLWLLSPTWQPGAA